jgi:hypothetical protein
MVQLLTVTLSVAHDADAALIVSPSSSQGRME